MGLGAAIDYVERIGIDNINRYEHELMAYATRGLSSVPGLRLIGTAPDKAGVLSFALKGFTTEEVGQRIEPRRNCGTCRSSLRAAYPAPFWP